MKGRFAALFVFAATGTAFAATQQVAYDRDGRAFWRAHVIVGLSPATPVPVAGSSLFGGIVERSLPQIDAIALRLPDGVSVTGAAENIAKLPGVRYAEPDYMMSVADTPNDPFFSQQYGPRKLTCDIAWDIWKGDANTVIAIVDTGINYAHPDLSAKYVGGFDEYNNDADPMDDHGHGTHCAGIAAASTNNQVGIAGVAYNCKLMGVKVLGAGGSGSTDTVAAGIIYAADHGAKVVSLSLGCECYETAMRDAVNYAWSQGVVVCAAAGNNGSSTLFYPAGHDNAIAVGATDSQDKKAGFSNYGSWVDVAAPGVGILSSYFNGYTQLSGTSMACPHVAGAAGLLYSKMGARSAANAQSVRNLLETTGDNIGTWIAHGRVNLAYAIAKLAKTILSESFAPVWIYYYRDRESYGGLAQVATADGKCLKQHSVVTSTWTKDGEPQYNYGTNCLIDIVADLQGSPITASLELTCYSSTSIISLARIYNWHTATWTVLTLSSSIPLTMGTVTAALPAPVTDFLGPDNWVELQVQTARVVPHNVFFDKVALKFVSYK